MNRDARGKKIKPHTSPNLRGRKRPTDVNQLAHFLGNQSTNEAPVNGDAPSKNEISRVMAALGRKGGKVGGANRAKALTPIQRREIALKAARARWDKNS